MFGRKKDAVKPAATGEDEAAKSVALKPRTRAGQALVPPREAGSFVRPEVVRPTFDVPRFGATRAERERDRERSSYGEGKKLIVGRDIVLSAEINACEKLVVEGRVEANVTDCREMEISETGTFKGTAEIDIAQIGGRFDGSLTARNLLLVRSGGRVSGTVRYGRIEIERGGEVCGDVQVLRDPAVEAIKIEAPAEAAPAKQG